MLTHISQIHFVDEPASQRAPPEILERIARFIPRYHLRTWLFVSAFHRDIAVRLIFHTVDLYFGEDQDLSRGLDMFDRVKADLEFASRVKALRLHWAYEESDMFDLVCRKWSHSFRLAGVVRWRTHSFVLVNADHSF